MFATPEVVDDLTVDIKTTKPYGLVLAMATYIFPMDSAFYTGDDPETGKPKDAIVKTDPSFALTHESGTGPYTVTFREQGVKTVFVRFKDYWDKASPGNVDEIVLTPIKEDATRVAALLSGDVDFIMPVPPQDLDRIRGNNAKLNLVTMSGSRIITVQLNQKRSPEASSQRQGAPGHRVRREQRGHRGQDHEGLRHRRRASRAPRATPGTIRPSSRATTWPRPRQLMKEAGYEKGFTCTMIAPNNRYVNDEKIAQAFASMVCPRSTSRWTSRPCPRPSTGMNSTPRWPTSR